MQRKEIQIQLDAVDREIDSYEKRMFAAAESGEPELAESFRKGKEAAQAQKSVLTDMLMSVPAPAGEDDDEDEDDEDDTGADEPGVAEDHPTTDGDEESQDVSVDEEPTADGQGEPEPEALTLEQLTAHNRDDLNTLATQAGVEEPDKLANKREVAEAILAKQSETSTDEGEPTA